MIITKLQGTNWTQCQIIRYKSDIIPLFILAKDTTVRLEYKGLQNQTQNSRTFM